MPRCPECRTPVAATARFCPACGEELAAARPAGPDPDATVTTSADPDLDPDATVATQPATPPPPLGTAPGGASSAAPASGEPRFVPGAMVDGRYRIVGLLGVGGMGEVYRADDLKLGQPVALKFLPAGLERDPERLRRFLNEVRTARQVSHPNVCRIHDVGEAGGQHYLSMEFVDGEDLASLLRRIGRLPQERAVEVARQICAGLGAAHAQGILHRDLKPANVMLDGRGRVRLTDFGLAGLAAEIRREDVASGTPSYMSPEQLAGREVTVRSDVYALGLLLYELFTGRRTFAADTAAELKRLHADTTPTSLSSHVQDLDPAVERAVMRCLEKDPGDRPPTALAVAAALPGGDPLAAALAAGETPSPELVAEAGEREGMRPGRALLLAVAALVLVVGATRWAGTMTVLHFLPLEKRPEVMVDRARTVIAELGYTEPAWSEPADRAWGLNVWNPVLGEVAAADSSAERWRGLARRPDAAAFWYRQSPRILRPEPTSSPIFIRGPVQLTNPSVEVPGETAVMLDLDGSLRRLEVMPKRYSTREPAEPDWGALFALANLDTARFAAVRPRYQRFMAPDVRRAWVGSRAEAPDVILRVEAGAFEGRPVLFNVSTASGLETLAGDPEPWRPTPGWYLQFAAQPLVILAVVVLALRLARTNLGQGRADRRGALRFGLTLLALHVLGTGLRSHALFTAAAADELWPLLVGGTFIAAAGWALYAAVEPVGRQVWPTMFVSSSRLLSRPRVRWLDPVVGESVLAGVLAGGVHFLLRAPLLWQARAALEGAPPPPLRFDLELLRGTRQALGLAGDLAMLLVFTFVFVASLVVIRRLVRRRLPALLLTYAVGLLMTGAGTGGVGTATAAIGTAIMLTVLLRWGVLALLVSQVTLSWCWLARVADWSAWYAEGPLLVLAALVALILYGAWAATGGGRGAGAPRTAAP